MMDKKSAAVLPIVASLLLLGCDENDGQSVRPTTSSAQPTWATEGRALPTFDIDVSDEGGNHNVLPDNMQGIADRIPLSNAEGNAAGTVSLLIENGKPVMYRGDQDDTLFVPYHANMGGTATILNLGRFNVKKGAGLTLDSSVVIDRHAKWIGLDDFGYGEYFVHALMHDADQPFWEPPSQMLGLHVDGNGGQLGVIARYVGVSTDDVFVAASIGEDEHVWIEGWVQIDGPFAERPVITILGNDNAILGQRAVHLLQHDTSDGRPFALAIPLKSLGGVSESLVLTPDLPSLPGYGDIHVLVTLKQPNSGPVETGP